MIPLEEGKMYKMPVKSNSGIEKRKQKLLALCIRLMENALKAQPQITEENLIESRLNKWHKYIFDEDLSSVSRKLNWSASLIITTSIEYDEFPDLSRPKSIEGIRLSRQLSKWFHKLWGYKMTQVELTELGSILESKEDEKFIYFRVLNPRTEKMWEPGQYADNGSCFWGGRIDARITLEKNEKFRALLFYTKEPSKEYWKDHRVLHESGYTLGRCWVFTRENGGFILFNGYFKKSEYTLNSIKSSIAEFFDTDYEKITLVNKGEAKNRLWVNEEGVGYLFADDAQKIGTIDMNTDVEKMKCSHCGIELTGDGFGSYTVDDVPHLLCSNCKSKLNTCMASRKLSFLPKNIWEADSYPTKLVLPQYIEDQKANGTICYIKRHDILAMNNFTYELIDKSGNFYYEWKRDCEWSIVQEKYILRQESTTMRTETSTSWVEKTYLQKLERKKDEHRENETVDVSARTTIRRAIPEYEAIG